TSHETITSWIAGVTATDAVDGTVSISNDLAEATLSESSTTVSFSATDSLGNETTQTYVLDAGTISEFDIDGNGTKDALTDGLLFIRRLFGYSGDSLTSEAVSSDATRNSAEISSYLDAATSELDIDGDGEAKALTDGLLLIRSLFGFSGDSLISAAIGNDAERATADAVSAFIEQRMP
ncbi:MAG TPA: hypothetical protein QF517_11145, partial [Pseudomonadales bacterium]|nr:hypothetical protein [Pseudomonadales bacterium]